MCPAGGGTSTNGVGLTINNDAPNYLTKYDTKGVLSRVRGFIKVMCLLV